MKKKLVIGGVAAAIAIAAVIIVIVSNGSDSNKYNYDLNDYVKVGKYTGLDYYLEKVSVSDEEVEQEIDNRLNQAAKTKDVKEGTVEDGDTINVKYVGKIDGKTFEGGSSDSQDITIGTTPMIEGFTSGLVGHKVGEKVKLDLKFPDDYHEESVKGKPVVFEVTINSKKVKTVPKLDEAFVKDSNEKYKTDYKNVKEYKAGVKKEINERKEANAKNAAKQALWSEVLHNSKAKKYPSKELKLAEKQSDEWEAQLKSQATAYGMEWKDFLKNAMNTDEKGFAEIKKNHAKEIVLNDMVLYSIAKKENISVSKREFKDKLDEIMKNSGYTDKTFKEAFNMSIEKYAEQNDWKKGMLLDKVTDKIMKDGKRVDKPIESDAGKQPAEASESKE